MWRWHAKQAKLRNSNMDHSKNYEEKQLRPSMYIIMYKCNLLIIYWILYEATVW